MTSASKTHKKPQNPHPESGSEADPHFLLHNITYQKSIYGIPWAFDQAQSHLVQWQAKFAAFQAKMLTRLQKTQQELRKVDLLSSTKARLEKVSLAYEEQLQFLNTLLPDFKASQDALTVLQALSDRIPSTQHFETYFNNIFRDWAWGDAENASSMQVLEPYFKEISHELRNLELVVLGAGACRLPLELHLKYQPAHTTVIDINPLLLITAKKLLEGEKVQLYEFPVPAADAQNVVHKHDLTTNLRAPDNFHFLFADGLNLPAPDQSLKAILTPWFIDIVPVPFHELATRLNTVMKKDAIWINFGPLGFFESGKSSSYTFEEIKEILSQCGFTIEKSNEEEIPYLHSPYCAQKRHEKVYLFRARKVKEVKKLPRYKYLPDYLSDPKQVFPMSEELIQVIQNARITADIGSLVDGRRSIHDMATLIAQNSTVPVEQAVENLLIFFVNLYETNLR